MLPVFTSNHVPLADLSASFIDHSSVVSYTQKATSSSISTSAASTSYFSNFMQKIADWLSSMWNWLTSFCCPVDPIQQRLQETAQSMVDDLFKNCGNIAKGRGYRTCIVLSIPKNNSGDFIQKKIHVNLNEKGVLDSFRFSEITESIDQAQMVVAINNPLGGGTCCHHMAQKGLDSNSPIQTGTIISDVSEE